MIARQLHREHRNLDSLYNTAIMYCKPNIVCSFFSKRQSITFTFNDSSKLRVERDTYGEFMWAGVEE